MQSTREQLTRTASVSALVPLGNVMRAHHRRKSARMGAATDAIGSRAASCRNDVQPV